MSSSLLKPSVTPVHGVGDQAARQAVELAELRLVGRALRDQRAVGELEVDAGGMRLRSLPFGPLHFDGVVEHLDGDALRNRDWFLSDS